ncbi:SDR family oxidoreductase [Williamsia sterculiae]|uniref:NADP-dependent 3-hydroxy acid dehydrogenase YdfG n=1 Tax=Williamsia sterculiae TaxID=1344003 RepID=A0A1N7DFX6_9NOCA|nr:SDR family oxidoreductase [Williamsia sterculiae]SIR74718.1 NADP-dependent 3-hydroxy acid dehydrogenase YdfG [Williamsia sterculiae]
MDIERRVAIVTGGGSGIGAAVARHLADAGARVVVADLDGAAADAVAQSISAGHADAAIGVRADAADTADITALIELAGTEFGPVDIYVANAGIAGAPGLDVSEAEWDLSFGINLRAHIRAAQLLVPDWIDRGAGYFLSTASAAGLLTQINSATYSVTKHAAVGFAEWLSVTYGDRGVRVSCLCPMGVDTPLLRAGQRSADPAANAAMRAVTTAGAVLTADAVAESVITAIGDERFLVLPHPEVLEMYRQKGADYDRWLAGMRRYQRIVTEGA